MTASLLTFCLAGWIMSGGGIPLPRRLVNEARDSGAQRAQPACRSAGQHEVDQLLAPSGPGMRAHWSISSGCWKRSIAVWMQRVAAAGSTCAELAAGDAFGHDAPPAARRSRSIWPRMASQLSSIAAQTISCMRCWSAKRASLSRCVVSSISRSRSPARPGPCRDLRPAPPPARPCSAPRTASLIDFFGVEEAIDIGRAHAQRPGDVGDGRLLIADVAEEALGGVDDAVPRVALRLAQQGTQTS